ncbi:MAG: dTDP-4-amino-4,6-dideoxygalactose transaminase [Methylophilaceae bacterium]
MREVPFNKPYLTGNEIEYIKQSHAVGNLSGDGFYTKESSAWLERKTQTKKALLTHSCTAALEMAALLADIQPGDEVIMPSYTFVSTANAFVLRGGIPVFVDIRPDTLNIDENLIEAAITNKTKAIVPVHYAGVACEMDTIMRIAKKHDLLVIEDAAQGVMSSYKGKALGAIGHIGAYSFHETKNIISGEGGAILVNQDEFSLRAEIIREKGTNRSQFYRGQVDKYTWQDVGSSYLPGEDTAAFLLAQLECAEEITQKRLAIWNKYHQAFEQLEQNGVIRRPSIPEGCIHNAHMYYVIVNSLTERTALIRKFKSQNIHPVFHYIPLHSAPAGIKYGRASGSMENTNALSDRLLRLPLWVGIGNDQDRVINVMNSFKFKSSKKVELSVKQSKPNQAENQQYLGQLSAIKAKRKLSISAQV